MFADLGYENSGADLEANLNMNMMEDSEDVIIPDNMRQFLQQQQRYNDNMQLSEGMEPQVQNGGLSQHFNSGAGGGRVDEWVRQTSTMNHYPNLEPRGPNIHDLP